MRTRIAILILLVVGIALAVSLLVGDRTLGPAQLEKVRTICPECHGDVPEYGHGSKVHNKHAALDCSSCHHNPSGLKTTDNIHAGLEMAG